MKIKHLFSENNVTLSFEVFPPARNGSTDALFSTIEQLVTLNPHFISVTYGADGSTRDMTLEIASRIKSDVCTEVLAHLTCVHATNQDITGVLHDFEKENIKNILALRGDPPKGHNGFVRTEGGFGYADELVAFIKQDHDFSIGIAGYPEGHVEAPSLDDDMANLKRKVDAGADFIITQLFFNNDDFYRFRDKAIARGIDIPIIAGIFPIFNFKQIDKIASLCGAAIPTTLHDRIGTVSEKSDEVEKLGTEYAIRQSEDLLKNDVAGLHFYSMNKSRHVKKIVKELTIRRKG